MSKVVVVIPTYNERENTEKMIEVLATEFAKIKKHNMHLLYVDDTSPDKTYEVVREKMKKYDWLHLLLNKEKKGLGDAKFIVSEKEEQLLVPLTAVVEEDGESFVWVVDGRRARRVQIEIGESSVDDVEVISGVKKGDTVIIRAPSDLEEGDRVKISC